MVDCKDCLHFRELAGDTVWKRRTGCYHPELMEQKQAERIHAAQEIPGDCSKLNRDGRCEKFAAKRSASLVSRLLSSMRS
ncbi:MAG: hypothetical protein JNN27_09870 [Planctomycetes bacterium]|nr:hypothetical protein [Planctomycetota bacterium]